MQNRIVHILIIGMAIKMANGVALSNTEIIDEEKLEEAILEIYENDYTYKELANKKEREIKAHEDIDRFMDECEKVMKELASKDYMDVDVDKYVKRMTAPDNYMDCQDIMKMAEAKELEHEVQQFLSQIKDKQIEEHKRIEREKARQREEARLREEAARRSAQQSSGQARSSQSSGGQKPTSNTARPAPKSHSSSREQWMWQLINSYPEPARRGLNGAQVVGSLGGNYAGLTYPDSMTIKIANWIKDNTFRGAVAHEIGHIYHLRTGLDETQEWIDIYNAEWAGSGYYGSANPMEAFADSFKAIYEPGSYGSRPTSQIPRSVNYIKRNLNSGI